MSCNRNTIYKYLLYLSLSIFASLSRAFLFSRMSRLSIGNSMNAFYVCVCAIRTESSEKRREREEKIVTLFTFVCSLFVLWVRLANRFERYKVREREGMSCK